MTMRTVLLVKLAVVALAAGPSSHAQEASRPDMVGEAESASDAVPIQVPASAASAWPSPIQAPTPVDTTGPTILHTPPVKAIAGGPFLLEAEVADPDGVVAVWLRYRSAPEEGWVSRSMSLAGAGQYRIGVEALPVEIQTIDYMLGARDGLGNQAMAGSLGEPLRLVLAVPTSPQPVTSAGMTSHTRGLLLVAAVLLAAWLFHRRSVASSAPPPPITTFRDRLVSEQDFWKRLLSPLVGRSMDEQIDAVRIIAARRLRHPIQGLKTFSAPYIMDRLVGLHQRELASHAHGKGAAKPVSSLDRELARRKHAVKPPVIVDLDSTIEASIDAAFADGAAGQITSRFSRVQLDGALPKPADWLRHLREELGIDVRLLEHDEEPVATAAPAAGASRPSPAEGNRGATPRRPRLG